jgi:hypothetical protein
LEQAVHHLLMHQDCQAHYLLFLLYLRQAAVVVVAQTQTVNLEGQAAVRVVDLSQT